MQTLEGGPIPANTRNDYGNPLPPNSSSGGLQTSSSSGLQSVPSNNTSVPGANSYGGTSDTAATGVKERGVAGSGLPREKVIVVDTKALTSTKTDGKFSSSLMEAGLKSGTDVKSTNTAQNESTKSQTPAAKATSSAKASEKSASSADSTKAAETAKR